MYSGRKYHLWLTVLISLWLASCASLSSDYDPPKVTVESFRALPSDDVGPRFEIKMRVVNPNKQSLDIAGISYSIDLLDKELLSGVTNDVPVIEGYSEEEVVLEASINLLRVLPLLVGIGRNPSEALNYRFSAKIDFNGFTPTQRVVETGTIALK
jgi:LEA14-like dessication related protein